MKTRNLFNECKVKLQEDYYVVTYSNKKGQARGDWAITNKTKIIDVGKVIRSYIESLDSAKFEA